MNKIKLIIFDLDGVIADLKEAHYKTLNEAILNFTGDTKFCIDENEHYKFYDGLPTKEKLKLLTKYKNLPILSYDKIASLKQELTLKYICDNLNPIEHLITLFKWLKEEKYKIAIASNSVPNTIYSVLVKQNLIPYVDKVFSNEDVKFSKPNPEIYFKSISYFGLTPKECLIIEDSPYGLDAARSSGAFFLKVTSINDTTKDNIVKKIEEIEMNKIEKKWDGKKWNILIPMAGAGSRFLDAGYKVPKPLIDVNNKKMIELVVSNLRINANFIFLVQKKHEDEYSVEAFLKKIEPNCKVVFVEALTDGAARTTLLAEKYINNDLPLLIVNSDQIIEWNSDRFFYEMEEKKYDGSILTFKSDHPKWSYAKLNSNGFIEEVAEKKVISDNASVGIYYWKYGKEYVAYAKKMIEKNIRVNNEFYICPVYNEAIQDNKKIISYEVEKMWGLGTPEDLDFFLKNYKE